MKKRYWLLLVLAIAVLGSGCATRRQVAEVQLDMDYLKSEHQNLKTMLARIDSMLVETGDGQKRLNAELKMSMGAIEERMLLVEQRLADAGMMVNNAVNVMESNRSHNATPADSSDTTRVEGTVDQLELYRLAYSDLTKGNYDLAIKGFEELLKGHAKSALADNAVYWIAECHYIKKSYANSQSWYERLLKDYPKSEHFASSKYKLGMSLYNQRYITKAKQYFQDVVKDYPGTSEADKAAEMLARYK